MRHLATLFGIGHLPHAPGTWGSLAAIPLAWGLHWLGGFPLLALATLVLIPLGWAAAHAYMAASGTHDPGEIVIDEVVGQWLALWPLSLGMWMQGFEAHLFPWPGWVGAFLLFRLFDIRKPWLVGWADRQPGATGVMLDDVIAGVFAALALSLLGFAAHELVIR